MVKLVRSLVLRALPIVVILAGVGYAIDRTFPISHATLFWTLNIVSAAGALSAVGLEAKLRRDRRAVAVEAGADVTRTVTPENAVTGKTQPITDTSASSGRARCTQPAKKRVDADPLSIVHWVLAVIAAFVCWRISFFPLMVFAGHGAAVGEWIQHGLGIAPGIVYPTFLVGLFAGHVVAAYGGVQLVTRRPRWWRFAVVPLLVAATTISFTVPDADLHPLPDRSLHADVDVDGFAARYTPARRPGDNPYAAALEDKFGDHGYSPQHRALQFAAASTYATVPESPWAGDVKGALEAMYRDEPRASSQARVVEHYAAYLAAHRQLGSGAGTD